MAEITWLADCVPPFVSVPSSPIDASMSASFLNLFNYIKKAKLAKSTVKMK